MGNFNFNQLPRAINYKTWERDYRRGGIKELVPQNWFLDIHKDEDDLWNVGYTLWDYEGPCDRLPKSKTLEEYMNEPDRLIDDFICSTNHDLLSPDATIHGIRNQDLEKASEELLLWLYNEGLI